MDEKNFGLDDLDAAAYRSSLERLSTALEAGNTERFRDELDALVHIRERELYREIGQLTRELHDALHNFQVDTRMTTLMNVAENEFPDALLKLNHVLDMTSDSAHRTLDMVERMQEDNRDQAKTVKTMLENYPDGNAPPEENREVFEDLNGYMENLRNGLSEIMMAQGYQDLSGQIIKGVINLVKEVENALVELVRVTGSRLDSVSQGDSGKPSKHADKGMGPTVQGCSGAEAAVGNQDDVDDLLSNLGF